MSVDQPFNIYREQLSSLYHGLALWNPKPVENLHKQPGHVSIGDVGYLDNGTFMRMFNVTLPWDDPSNRLLGIPEKYKRIELCYPDNVRDDEIRDGEYYTPHVSEVDNVGANTHEDSIGQMYQCRAQHRGALLSLPHSGHRKDIIPIKVFEDYIKDNVDDWFRWSRKMKLPVEHMEDLILVTGCTMVTSWAAAAFEGHMSVDSDASTISLEARKFDGGRTLFFWRNIRGSVEYHNSRFNPNVQEPPPQNQCVFIRGFRAKRAFFRTIPMRAAAEPLPDDPDNCREDEIQVTRIPDSSNSRRYRDPLVGILDYIIQKCNEDISGAEDIIAIAHDDDLQLMEGLETLTADVIENFLHNKQMPLVARNGYAILRDPADTSSNEPPVYFEKEDSEILPYAASIRVPQKRNFSSISPSTSYTPSRLPPLPKIRSPQILEHIFTHRSLFVRPKRVFEDSPSEANFDNEQLISVGDQVFGLLVTDLIRETFPKLSKVRDRLKYHGKLAKIAVQYGLHERLRVQASQAHEVRWSVHAQAEVFKAYVGGLYKEQGLDVVGKWFRSLLLLDIKEAYEIVRREYLLPPL